MSKRLHLSLLTAAMLLQAGNAAAELPERDTGRTTSASAFAALAGVEAEPLGPAEMDEVQGRTDVMTAFNMQYLTLQQAIQYANRQFTTLSNVMKTKHDTAKNALSNLK